MNVWPLSTKEKSLIYDSLTKLINFLKDDDNVEMVFIHITEFEGLNPTLNSITTCKDLVVNILCNDRKKFNNFGAFNNIKDIQTFVENTFAYLSVWQKDSETINSEIFKKFFSRSFIVIEKDKSNKYFELWKNLQNDFNIPQREIFYIDFFKDNIIDNQNERNVPKLLLK